eukprot:TRINITY_DN2829_c0_g1_i5.p1 TRINITY_DN2829_c0_g1~~TRINITY_DN2829_c0_g1_i5.p1  ORF type:complete len:222 (-),score=26.00 TRINITY_DN2829_c0_g1_i5:252-917(-)
MSDIAAKELGLLAGTKVGIGCIDAHAGAIGSLGTYLNGQPHLSADQFERRLVMIAGTSACHLVLSKNCIFTKGVWGPYYNALVPGYWLAEGGQTAVGSLLDRIIEHHSTYAALVRENSGKSIYEILNSKINEMASQAKVHPAMLTKNHHMLPYFHGNRSPRADPSLTGSIVGLTLDPVDLPLLYLSALQSIAYGTKHIIEELNKSGHKIETIVMTGGKYRM